MADYIDRQAALNAIEWTWAGKAAFDALKALPSADVQPVRHGHWTDDTGIEGAWNYCSVCGEQSIDLYDYCPNCGARMDGE